MKAYWAVEVYLHAFLTSALDGGEWSASRPGCFTPGRTPDIHWRRGGHRSRFGRGGEEKNSQPLPGLEPPIIQPVAQRYTTELSWLFAINSESEHTELPNAR
jgi:hypothetical protein